VARDENIIDYVFRAKDAKKVEDAAQQITEAFQNMVPAGSRGSDAIEEVEESVEDLGRAQDDLNSKGSIADRLKSSDIAKIAAGFATATAAVAVFQKALQSLQDTFDFTVLKAAAQEDAILRLENAFVAAGTFSRQASADFQEFASSMQAVTAAGDEEVLALGALIGQIGKLRGSELERATKAALDMQAALGKTSQEVGIFLGKLAQGETGSLTEIGIVIDQTIPKSEKFLAGLEAIEDAFGGTAEAVVRSYTGATQQLSNAWGDFGEAIGEIVLPTLTRFAQQGASLFGRLSTSVRELTGSTKQSAEDLARGFSVSLQNMGLVTEDAREEFEKFVAEISKRTEVEIKMEIERSSLESAIDAVENLEDAMERATGNAEGTFNAFQERIRRVAAEAIEQKIIIATETAEAEFQNILSGLLPPLTIDARIEGTETLRAMREALRQARDGSTEFANEVERAESQLAGLQARLEKLESTIPQTADAKQFVEQAIAFTRGSIISAEQTIANLREQMGGLSEDTAKAVEKIRQELKEFGGEARLEEQLVIRINAAETIAGIEEILAALERARATVKDTPTFIPVAEALDRLIDGANAVAKARVEAIRLAESMAEAEAPVERVVQALVKLQQITGSTTFEDIETEKLVRGVTDVTEANGKLLESIDRLAKNNDIDELRTAYQVLSATIKASEDGVAGLDDEMRKTFDASLLRVEALIQALEPLERERIIKLRFEAKEAKDKAKQTGKETTEGFEEALNDLSLDVLESTAKGAFGTMAGDLDDSASFMEARFKSMVDEFLSQMARLAAVGFFKLVADIASGGATLFVPPGFGGGLLAKPGQGEPPLGAPGDLDGSTVRQFTGAVVRPLEQALDQITLQNRLLVAQQPLQIPRAAPAVVPFVEDEARRTNVFATINALDSSDFERYMRDGPGRRAVAALSAQGRF
jgi:hypothetical protein